MNKLRLPAIILTILGIISAAAVSYVSYVEMKRDKEIEREIELMRSEADIIRRNNENLRDKISYFETRESKESVAKEKLNLQQPGERVVVIKQKPYDEIVVAKGQGEEEESQAGNKPNYAKWWEKFFKS